LTSREVVRYPQPATRSVAPARRLWNHLTSSSAELEEPIVPISRIDNLVFLRKDIQANIRRAYDRNVRQYNLRAKPTSFREGQEVYRRNFAQSKFVQNFNAKLGPQFVKCRIRKKKLGNCYYQLENFQGKEVGTYHAKDIRS